MEKAIGYIRVSTEKQADEGASLELQRDRITAYCRLHGLDLALIIEDQGVSGSIPLRQRPDGREIDAALKQHHAKHVIGLKLDRLFRDAADALTQTKSWDNAGIGLHLIDVGGQTINTATAMGRMFLTMMAGFAELERNLIAERTASALQNKKARLEVYSALPLGYEAQDGKLIPIDEEGRVVAEIQDMRDQGMTLRDIAGDLNERGIKGKRGGKFYASTIKAILDNDLHLHTMV